jgi:hypothetical protein
MERLCEGRMQKLTPVRLRSTVDTAVEEGPVGHAMDMRHAREIVDRADEHRRMFDARKYDGMWKEPAPWFAVGAICAAGAVPFLGLAYRSSGPTVALAMFAIMMALPFVGMIVFISWQSRWKARRLAETAARVECPNCATILRADGPLSWSSCADNEIVCPTCGTTTTEESYAAATLRAPWREMCRNALISPRQIVAIGLVFVIALGGVLWMLSRVLSIDIDTPQAEVDAIQRDIRWLAPLAQLWMVAGVAIGVSIIPLGARMLRARFVRWTKRPTCLVCAAPLDLEGSDAPIIACESCGERYSRAQVRIDIVDGARRPIWPRREWRCNHPRAGLP